MTADEMRFYRGSNGAERVQQRREALLDAAFELIAEDGWRNLRVAAIAAHAGLSKRYIYESFTDIDELTRAVTDRLGEGLLQAIDAADPALSLEDATRQSLRAIVRYVTGDPRRAKVLFVEVPGTEGAARYRRLLIQRLTGAAATRGRLLHHLTDDTDPIAELTASFLLTGTMATLLEWIDGTFDMSEDEIISDLTALWIGATLGALDRGRHRPKAPHVAGPAPHTGA